MYKLTYKAFLSVEAPRGVPPTLVEIEAWFARKGIQVSVPNTINEPFIIDIPNPVNPVPEKELNLSVV